MLEYGCYRLLWKEKDNDEHCRDVDDDCVIDTTFCDFTIFHDMERFLIFTSIVIIDRYLSMYTITDVFY